MPTMFIVYIHYTASGKCRTWGNVAHPRTASCHYIIVARGNDLSYGSRRISHYFSTHFLLWRILIVLLEWSVIIIMNMSLSFFSRLFTKRNIAHCNVYEIIEWYMYEWLPDASIMKWKCMPYSSLPHQFPPLEKAYDSYPGISEQKMVRSKNYNIRTQSCSRRNQQSRCSAIHWELYCCTLCLASRL